MLEQHVAPVIADLAAAVGAGRVCTAARPALYYVNAHNVVAANHYASDGVHLEAQGQVDLARFVFRHAYDALTRRPHHGRV